MKKTKADLTWVIAIGIILSGLAGGAASEVAGPDATTKALLARSEPDAMRVALLEARVTKLEETCRSQD